MADDAAAANWGNSWRMPTKEEEKELLDNTTHEWTKQNGIYGLRFTSKTNDRSIFFPAAGIYGQEDTVYVGTKGYYWSSSLGQSGAYGASHLIFSSSDVYVSPNTYRCYGLPVRPILNN